MFSRTGGLKIQGMTAHAVGALLLGSADNWNFNASNPCLHFGGNYNQNANYGMFYVNYNAASNYNGNLGCRFLFDIIQIGRAACRERVYVLV